MNRRHILHTFRLMFCIGAVLATCLCISPLQAQNIIQFNVPQHLCAGTTETLSFGFNTTHNTVIQAHHATLGQSELTFLPDGVPCNGRCSYQSPVTFSDFAPNATITSNQDIEYVRLKIEHSYIGDIYIALHCPNGQDVSLMNYGGTGTSQCNSTITSEHRNWSSSYTNTSTGTYLGNPVDYEANDDCDPNAYDNRPGTGWNYCWSNNTHYSYAAQDGLIYRKVNEVQLSGGSWFSSKTIDSSNVAAGTHFYKPNQNFSNLAGCPLNGTWYIEVIDGWSGDNGWIFEWELALNPNLIPNDCDPTGYNIVGPYINSIDDSTFTISVPEDITHDTTIEYTFLIFSSCGDTIDTTAFISLHPEYTGVIDTTVCDSLVWGGRTYTTSRNINYYGTTTYGCDSTGSIHLTVNPSYHPVFGDTIVENELPYTFGGVTFTHAVYDTLLERTSIYGCDSSTLFSLKVYINSITVTDTTLCDDLMPYMWHGNAYSVTCTDTVFEPTASGADSMFVLHLTVLPTSDTSVFHEAVENSLPVIYNEQSYTTDTSVVFHFENRYGCDSTVHYHLTVHFNQDTHLRRAVCDDRLPYTWQGVVFDSACTQSILLLDRFGADSTVYMTLIVHPTYDTTFAAEACDNKPIEVAGVTLSTQDMHTITLHTIHRCDSTLHVDLTVYPHWELHFYDTVCRSDGSPFEGNIYTLAGDYPHEYVTSHGCDSTRTLHLKLLAEDLKAEILASPWMVTRIDPTTRLYDQSTANATRLWEIRGETYIERNLTYTYPIDEDSVVVSLIAYSPEGCADSTTGVLRIDRACIFAPNAFTPACETNNRWFVAGTDIAEVEIWIYNRFGALVAHLESMSDSWDGTAPDGRPCPQGEYVYTMRYRTAPQPFMPIVESGSILLIR